MQCTKNTSDVKRAPSFTDFTVAPRNTYKRNLLLKVLRPILDSRHKIGHF